MQFITDGPDIPEVLLQTHEEGRVVFFCGAGVSYPAGLPGFSGLVKQIYEQLGTSRNAIEEESYRRQKYDATLDLLERRIPGQRLAVRRALATVLKPKLRRKGASDTHAALLELAKGRDGATRLVTTNFDRLFERLMTRAKPKVVGHQAPYLPIPKNSRWNGVVYLHGLLPEAMDDGSLQRLVLTSGDFGLAYLTEGWAARFVSELFRNYIVCFVGYSIEDPVLRYMMDALAADRMLGESVSCAYAFGSYSSAEERAKRDEWEAKGVTPIMYEVPEGTQDHSALHRTLKAWADTYRDGVQGRERIVAQYAMIRPTASTRQDDFVGRMLWALSHDSGLPAKVFSEFDPVPSLDWLAPLSESRYQHDDLPRFDIPPRARRDENLVYSITRRPTPYHLAPWMMFVKGWSGQWDDVMYALARWMIRHLDDPALILWLANQGGQLHENFAKLLEDRLNKIVALERDGKTEELERIRASAPRAIPSTLMRTLWRLFLSNRVKASSSPVGLYLWQRRFRNFGLTTSIRLELRDMLSPRIVFKRAIHFGLDESSTEQPDSPEKLLAWELALSADGVTHFAKSITKHESWKPSLLLLFDDSQQLLRDALDLLREMNKADNEHDRSYWDLPSISPHWQNRGFRDWVVLIELLRDAWLAIREQNPDYARRLAQDWWTKPYPTFKRLALFAASHEGMIPGAQWVEWLKSHSCWWLWSVETRRETMRLLVLQGARLDESSRAQLEYAILSGPHRRMYREDLSLEEWEELVDHSVWLRLAKLASSGCSLGESALAKFAALAEAHPGWKLADNEKDEFSFWISETRDTDYKDLHVIERAPRNRVDLVEWLRRPPSKHPSHSDDWVNICKNNCPTALYALCALANEGQWPVERWRDALQAWREGKLLALSWRHGAPLLLRMPEKELFEISHAVTWWLEAAVNIVDQNDSVLFDICQRFLVMDDEYIEDVDRLVVDAINHTFGHIAQIILNRIFRDKPNDNQGLPEGVKSLLTSFCDTRTTRYRPARMTMASNVIGLFRIDQNWTRNNLLQLFNWEKSHEEARSAWVGFLWSPRLYNPLIVLLKDDFLESAHHYTDLGSYARQYAAFLTYVAIDHPDVLTADELRDAFSSLPSEGLQESAEALRYSLEGAVAQRGKHWENRVLPFWHKVWPKALLLKSEPLAEQLARLSIAALDEFPSAVAIFQDWLQSLEHPDYVVSLLEESKLCNKFPKEALTFLDKLIDDQPWAPDKLGICLETVAHAWPEAHQDPRYARLSNYYRRHRQ